MYPFTEQLNFAKSLAESAGQLILEKRLENKLQQNFKGGIELVTDADLASDKLITESIKAKYPEHWIVSEESNPGLQYEEFKNMPTWIVDPIDGTVNYAHHHPHSAISIAYVEESAIQLGVVYNPFSNELFYAGKNQGAFLNGQPIQCADKSLLAHALVATGFPYEKAEALPELMKRVQSVLEAAADIRRLGSAALDICWVAMGRLDAYYESVALWDCAAAWVIAQEAGATCGHFIEPPQDKPAEFCSAHLLVASPKLFEPLKMILNKR